MRPAGSTCLQPDQSSARREPDAPVAQLRSMLEPYQVADQEWREVSGPEFVRAA